MKHHPTLTRPVALCTLCAAAVLTLLPCAHAASDPALGALTLEPTRALAPLLPLAKPAPAMEDTSTVARGNEALRYFLVPTPTDGFEGPAYEGSVRGTFTPGRSAAPAAASEPSDVPRAGSVPAPAPDAADRMDFAPPVVAPAMSSTHDAPAVRSSRSTAHPGPADARRHRQTRRSPRPRR